MSGEMTAVWEARLKLESWSSISLRLKISVQVAKALHRSAQTQELSSVADMRAEQIDRLQSTLALLYKQRDDAATAQVEANTVIELAALLTSSIDVNKQIGSFEDMLAKVVGTFAAKKTSVSIDSLTQRIEDFTASIGHGPHELVSNDIELADFTEEPDYDVSVPPTRTPDPIHGGGNPPSIYRSVHSTASNRVVPEYFGDGHSVEGNGDVFNFQDHLNRE